MLGSGLEHWRTDARRYNALARTRTRETHFRHVFAASEISSGRYLAASCRTSLFANGYQAAYRIFGVTPK